MRYRWSENSSAPREFEQTLPDVGDAPLLVRRGDRRQSRDAALQRPTTVEIAHIAFRHRTRVAIRDSSG